MLYETNASTRERACVMVSPSLYHPDKSIVTNMNLFNVVYAFVCVNK